MVAISHNGQIVDKTRKIVDTYETCVNSFDIHNDIFRIFTEGQGKVNQSG